MRKLLLTLVVAPLLVGIAPRAAVADNDDLAGPDENIDVARRSAPPRDTRPARPSAPPTTSPGEFTVLAAPVPGRVYIDDFRYDELVLEGTAAEVCVGRLLPGAGWTFNELVGRFGGTAGTMYYCRERWDTATDPDCNGQTGNPVTNPSFYSECWSNHAQGRAIDIMVGRTPTGYNATRGRNIVNWLLATDANGNVNANARKLGIQQLLFGDRCWNSDGDRGISSWSSMRECGIGHHDHVHIDMTTDGANGDVSYWGAEPKVDAKLDTQAFWDVHSHWREAISWWHMESRSEEGVGIPPEFDQIIVGDFDRDGLQDETFLWDQQTGNWAVQNWNAGDALTATIGRFSGVYDTFVMGDFDADGFVNDMLVWDHGGTGTFTIVSWQNYLSKARTGGLISPDYDQLVAGDFNADGLNNDLLAWDKHSGLYVVWQGAGWRLTRRRVAYLPNGADVAIVGDWSAGGDLDDVIMWDQDNGRWALYSFIGFTPKRMVAGAWSTAFDVAAPGDYDTDGRVDDLYIYDIGGGYWRIYSFHRTQPTLRTYGQWSRGFDFITVGSFLD